MDFLLKIKDKLRLSAPLMLTLISLLDFLIYYIIQLFFWDSDVAAYISHFSGRFFEFAIPIFAAALMLVKMPKGKKMLLYALCLALPRLIYSLPYYYLRYVYDVYDSKEAIVLSLITNIAVILLLMLKTLLLYAVIRLLMKRAGTDEPKFPLSPFDFDSPVVFGIMISALIPFVIELALEVYSTVSFFIEKGAKYRTDDIIFYCGSFVFLIASLILSHTLACLITNLIKRKSEKAEKTE